jgi:hypothetical protein
MRADALSSVESYLIDGVVWRCWIRGGDNAYEWRALDGRLRVWRRGGFVYASVGGVDLRHPYERLRDAMTAAMAELARAA